MIQTISMRLACVIVLSAIASGCQHGGNSCRNLHIGKVLLVIPNHYVSEADMPILAMANRQQDHMQDVLLKFPLSEVLHRSSGSARPRADSVFVRLVDIGPNAPVNADATDAWMQQGLYLDRIIEPEPDLQLVRIYAKDGYPALWNYFREQPSTELSNADINSLWIASCRTSPNATNKSVSGASCVTTINWQTLLGEVHFPGHVITEIDQLLNNLRGLLGNFSTDHCI